MKKLVLFLSCVLFVTIASAQIADSNALRKHYIKMYDMALQYNDVSAAIHALHGYIAETDDLNYKDTLSMLYFSTKSYYSALMLSEEVYKKTPDNLAAMARAGECYDELGDPKTAVALFEQVCPKTKNPYHYYRLALGQYELKRNGECEASAKIVMADTNSKKAGITFQMGNGNNQAIPINAAAANLLGVMQMDANNFEGAKPYFKQALVFFPDFAGAKQNLRICDDKTKGKVAPKTIPKPKG